MKRILDATNLRMSEITRILPLRFYPHLAIERVGDVHIGLE